MNSKKILLLTCFLGILLSFIYYLYSPDTVPTHFNTQGIPDSWIDKNSNLILWVGMYLVMTALFSLIPLIIRKTPLKYINLPNKQYWLAPEKKDNTIQNVSDMLFQFGAVLNIFFIVLRFIVFRAVSYREYKLNTTSMFILLGMYSLYIIWWLVKFYRQFTRISNHSTMPNQ